ncbi:unnamed protein product [Arabis nemorensis]|uniref:Uncharacterized protein n=1 Tax=Arabis nemorensis TaxID=586526 RepID=A0A565BAW0_9BRAS|nr:unnamed protein product [Arabis nemorensis]
MSSSSESNNSENNVIQFSVSVPRKYEPSGMLRIPEMLLEDKDPLTKHESSNFCKQYGHILTAHDKIMKKKAKLEKERKKLEKQLKKYEAY